MFRGSNSKRKKENNITGRKIEYRKELTLIEKEAYWMKEDRLREA